MIRSKSMLLAAAVLAGLTPFAMADGTVYVNSSGGSGLKDGSSPSNAFGTVQAAYNAAASGTGVETVQLAAGTYNAAAIGPGPNGNVGAINLGSDGGGAGPSSISATSIVFNGASGTILTENGASGNTTSHGGTSVFDDFNGTIPISVNNLKIDLSTPANAGRDQVFESNNGGSPIVFNNDTIDLRGGAVLFNGKATTGNTGDVQLNSSSLYLGKTGGGFNIIGYAYNGYNNGSGPPALVFNGENTSSIYDSSGNPITDLSTIAELNEQFPQPISGPGTYPPYYQNGKDFTQTTSEPFFADNFVVTPEPASLSLLGFAALGLLARRRRD